MLSSENTGVAERAQRFGVVKANRRRVKYFAALLIGDKLAVTVNLGLARQGNPEFPVASVQRTIVNLEPPARNMGLEEGPQGAGPKRPQRQDGDAGPALRTARSLGGGGDGKRGLDLAH